MSFKKQCKHIQLGSNDVGDVMFCTDCGVVSVSLQCMTVRLEAEAFVELAALLGETGSRLLNLVKAHAEDVHGRTPRMQRHVH